MNKYVEDCPCGNHYPHGVEFAGRYQFVCDKCGRKTKWFYERNNARYSWNRKIRYKRNKEKGIESMETKETELKVKLEDIVLLAESTAKLAKEVYDLHLEIVNGNGNKRS